MRGRVVPRVVASVVVSLLLLVLAPVRPAHADAIDDLENQIAANQARLAAIQAQSAAVGARIAGIQAEIAQLQSLIGVIDSELLTTNARLSAEQARLDSLTAQLALATDQLASLESQLAVREAQFDSQTRMLDKVEQTDPWRMLLASGSFVDFMNRLSAIKEISDNTAKLAVEVRSSRDLVQGKRDEIDAAHTAQSALVDTIARQKAYLDQQYALEASARDQLYVLQASLGAQQAALAGQAAALQSEIADEQAQINSILAFAHGQGGDIVAPEFLSDAWGAYYNQRDARWGDDYVGPSPYLVWEIGCLLSSTAMVYTHFGFTSVTPGSLARNASNFTADGLMYNSVLDIPGHTPTIQSYPSRDFIASYLSRGGVVIVGMFIATGGTHFVVLRGLAGSNDYWINDPWEPFAMHVSYNSSPVTGPIYTAIAYDP
jgi:peptidoglycan hydrolase CwlO-like protein